MDHIKVTDQDIESCQDNARWHSVSHTRDRRRDPRKLGPARISLLRSMPRCIGRASDQLSHVLLPVRRKAHIYCFLRQHARTDPSSTPAGPFGSGAGLTCVWLSPMQLDVVLITRAKSPVESRWATDGGWVSFSLMQLHPSRFHSEEPLWVDCLAVLAVGDQIAYIPASSSTRPRGPTLAQVPWYVDSRLNGATRRRPTMPCRSTQGLGDLGCPRDGCPIGSRCVPR